MEAKKFMKGKKTKIVLSLLIALTFILPTTSMLADKPTEIDEAGIIRTRTFEKPEFRSLDPMGGQWPIEVNDINIASRIAPGTYNITAEFCRPDYFEGWPVVFGDGIMQTEENYVLIVSAGPSQASNTYNVYATSDCDYIYLYMEILGPTGGPSSWGFDDVDLRIPGTGTFYLDTTTYAGITCEPPLDGVSPYYNPTEIRIDRSLIDGDCNTEDFTLRFQFNCDWGEICTWQSCSPLGWPEFNYDCGPAEIKKFIEIYKEWDEPEFEEEIYCTDFEEPCDIYEEWSTLDKSPDWGPNGAIDTWTWTDKRSHSPDHSFHSTAFDTYLMNQHDILEFNMGGQGLSMFNESMVRYDFVDINFSHWMEGDSIVVGTTRLIQDGGYVEYKFEGGGGDGLWHSLSETFYETTDWDMLNFTIPVEGDYLFVRFVFFSDAAFCYEGWYIDDVCITGIQDEFGHWEFVHDSHSHEQIMEGACIDHKFIDSWDAEEGSYKICVWLQTLDDCHYPVHTSDIHTGQRCFYVDVEDCLDIADVDLYFDPETPAWEGEDVEIFSEVYNNGTIDATDVQVRVTVQYGAENTVLDEGFDCDVQTLLLDSDPAIDRETDWWQSEYGGDVDDPQFNDRSWWNFDEWNGDCALLNFDQDGDREFSIWEPTLDGYASDYTPTGWVVSPFMFEAGDANLGVTVEFDAAWALPEDCDVNWFIAVSDDSAGRLTYFVNPKDITSSTDDCEAVSNGDGSFRHIGPLPYESLIASMVDGGTTGPTDTDLSFMIWFEKPTLDPASALDWSGIVLDNIVIKKLQIQEEPILFQETKEIDFLNITESETVSFNWTDPGVGRYIITEEVLPINDCDPTNNVLTAPYNVINFEDCMEEDEVEFIDHTEEGPCYWMVDDCCGGSLWVGDYETTMYGNLYDQLLYIAPEDEDGIQNKTLVTLDHYLEFDQWYQIDDTGDDAGYVEVSTDDGQHWTTIYGPVTGSSSPSPDPDGEDDWVGSGPIVLPDGNIQVRFRFISDNDSVNNRGWMIDNVIIYNGEVLIDDPCETMDNFICSDYFFGNWWQSPHQYYYYNDSCIYDEWWADWGWYNFYLAIPPSTTWWDYVFGGVESFGNYGTAEICAPPEQSFGCFDPLNSTVAWGYHGTYTPYYTESVPKNIDNSLDWEINTNGVFYGYFDGAFVADIGSDNDSFLVTSSADGGEHQYLYQPTDFAGRFTPGLLNDKIGDDTTTIRFNVKSDDVIGPYPDYDGSAIEGICFYGMKDNDPPISTITMIGEFDEEYAYYTSDVQVTITATDALSGVTIYYELDGTQYTYSSPFRISGDGTHTLCYWAEDGEGNVEEKKCVAPFRIDTSGPGVSITGPEPGIYLMGNKILNSDKYIFLFGGITVTASVNIDGAPLQSVEFYLNNVLMGEDTASPFTLTISAKNTGAATIKVIAKDVLGETSEDTLAIDTYLKLF
jgi:hypothetical protein